MTFIRGRLFWVLALLASGNTAFAQDDPRLALVASFPTPTVSIQWELSDRWAVRIDGSYSYRDESTESGSTNGSFTSIGPGTSIVIPTEIRTESTSHNSSIGFAGIFNIRRSEELRLYVAPRVFVSFFRQHITSTRTVSRVPPGVPAVVLGSLSGTQTFEASSTSPGAGVSFGAASNVHRRLALFGEAGFTYSRSDLPAVGGTLLIGPGDSFQTPESRRTAITTRAVGGVMIRF